jgi:RNA polymerase sigma-70 factor (ECF subfamily)
LNLSPFGGDYVDEDIAGSKGTLVNLFDRMHERFLVRQFQHGNTAAFLALVRRYERRLLYYLRRFERDRELALDALQDVWLCAWRTRQSLQSTAAFKAWIYRIAHGKIVGHIRVEQRRRKLERERADAGDSSSDCQLAAWESAELVHFALSRLTPEHREILTLRFLEEMSLAEIAEVTNCPVGTVKSRLHYASQAIQSIIEEQDHADKELSAKLD